MDKLDKLLNTPKLSRSKIDLNMDDDDDDEADQADKHDIDMIKYWENRIVRFFKDVKESIIEFTGSDWLYLALLGLSMGIFSYVIDVCIEWLRWSHRYIFKWTGLTAVSVATVYLQYIVWITFTLTLVMTAAIMCHYIAPQAIGSGIPELKTILRGTALNEYLTLRTLIVKSFGLVLALGSGLPLGKEGPFVHIASILATLLSKFIVTFKSIYENDHRINEMLAAACAVGVAGTYGAPIGGVLFSIEVTSVFFPLRNYWRSFFATVCSAITFRLFTVWFHNENTVLSFSPTSFPAEYPFDPKELIVFALIGILCGFGAALFIAFHRGYVHFIGNNKYIQAIIKKNAFIYPVLITLLIASLRCPLGYGRLFAGALTPREALDELFSNFSWNNPVYNTTQHKALVKHWSWTSDTWSIFMVLALYTFNMFWMTAVSITLPVPSGVFIPVFVTGAAFGRFIGELLALMFPHGFRTDAFAVIVPGTYAIVGAAAFSGAVTHAISTSVIVFEITGQFLYILPVILAVLLANAICARFQPSIYDSIIQLKRLPYLPKMPPISSAVHRIHVEDIMQKNVKYISLESTYYELKQLLEQMPKLKAFPIVDRPVSLILIGSITRVQLEALLEMQVGERVRKLSALKAYWAANSSSRQTSVNETKRNQTNYRKSAIKKVLSQTHFDDMFVNKKQKQSMELERQENDQAMAAGHSSPTKVPLLTTIGNKIHNWSEKLKLTLKLSGPEENSWLQDGVDFSTKKKSDWETARLQQILNFDCLRIDPAPFQLVERTSLYKVHALFSLLGLNRAYVTCLGSLVGVVALKELRAALENTQVAASSSPADSDRFRHMRRSSSLSSLDEQIFHGTSLGTMLRPTKSIPAKLGGTSSVTKKDSTASTCGYDLSAFLADFVDRDKEIDDDDDDDDYDDFEDIDALTIADSTTNRIKAVTSEYPDDDHVTVTLRKLSHRNSCFSGSTNAKNE